ncbi:hypothetical protein FF011L_42730 [Roseimaritima multifibrata]|uniref:Carboxypeptidase regulatory-like domain-containing protein n=1 Tax=Roseimaritima multifibrata TaxID=1930274 RepID=A0A517ML28_9BACT|nr:hypothetical protein [Roseimaritima multifibrata]QDS95477.1 hypothetical protein FF011L_42730 [Roseimaritima multifibrata]
MSKIPLVRRFGFSVSIPLIGLVLAGGCGQGDSFPTAHVSGQVVCQGKPVSGAMVYFEPVRTGSQASSIVGKQGFAFTDSEGHYVLSTYAPGEGDGAVVGMHRVRVGRGDAQCECSMNEEVDLMQAEVLADTDNFFDLVLPKASGRQLALQKRNRDEDDE